MSLKPGAVSEERRTTMPACPGLSNGRVPDDEGLAEPLTAEG